MAKLTVGLVAVAEDVVPEPGAKSAMSSSESP